MGHVKTDPAHRGGGAARRGAGRSAAGDPWPRRRPRYVVDRVFTQARPALTGRGSTHQRLPWGGQDPRSRPACVSGGRTSGTAGCGRRDAARSPACRGGCAIQWIRSMRSGFAICPRCGPRAIHGPIRRVTRPTQRSGRARQEPSRATRHRSGQVAEPSGTPKGAPGGRMTKRREPPGPEGSCPRSRTRPPTARWSPIAPPTARWSPIAPPTARWFLPDTNMARGMRDRPARKLVSSLCSRSDRVVLTWRGPRVVAYHECGCSLARDRDAAGHARSPTVSGSVAGSSGPDPPSGHSPSRGSRS